MGTAAADDIPSGQATVGDITARDELIAAQESLLNTYRCMFGVDTQVVPGGCADGQPVSGSTQPGVFQGTPTTQDVKVRDNLVASQEALLNTYRCLFNIDTQIVPGGCPDQPSTPTDAGTTPTGTAPTDTSPASAAAFTAVSTGSQHTCGIRTDQTLTCWGAADPTHLCALTSSYSIKCEGDVGEGYGLLNAPSGNFHLDLKRRLPNVRYQNRSNRNLLALEL